MSRFFFAIGKTFVFPTTLFGALAALPGCDAGLESSTLSPVVHPDSPEARRASEETENMIKERQAAEAKAHRRRPKLPHPESNS